MPDTRELRADELYRRVDPGHLDFDTTAQLPELEDVIGQPRAIEAVRFGMGIQQIGFNIFALGSAGTGRRSVVHRFMAQNAQHEPVPPDWCYVNNFEEPNKPKALRLPPGTGMQLRRDMEELINESRTGLATALESEEYRGRRQVIEQEVKESQERALAGLQERAQQAGLGLLRTPVGVVFAPVRDGEVVAPEEFQKLPEDERHRIEEVVKQLQEELQTILSRAPSAEREVRARVQELNREFIALAIGRSFDELRSKYASLPAVVEHLKAVQEDIMENSEALLRPQEAPARPDDGSGPASQPGRGEPLALRRYRVNVLVDNSNTQGAPVIMEDNPTYANLIGEVEHLAQMGALITDFNLIKAGALHHANGGYLILDARQVLQQTYAWEGLKRALLACKIMIESIGQALSMISTVTLEPEPIPLDVKVALIGDRNLYYLLTQLDPDFDKLFKVEADFSDEMDRTPDTQMLYARLIGTLAQKHGLKALDRAAVARIIEHGSRLVSDTEKLTTRVRSILDLIREADYWAGENGQGVITAGDIQRAIDAQTYRSNRIRERVLEEIARGTVLIDTRGSVVGQVNGLSVLQLGNFTFGRPTRITARVRLGEGQVVDIEREVELSGPIHSKGVLILASFLGARYAAEQPLSLSANLVFEQSYSGVEGDSASSAELYALLSAIAQVPIKQSLAVTGAVNQYGQVQAIGGVNEKIEGFFDVCKARGLTGDQGVLIPASNVRHLMLRQDVVEAVDAGQFHIYPVEHIDQGIGILTGIEAGERDGEGKYPEGSINARVEARLAFLVEKRLQYAPELSRRTDPNPGRGSR